jgi:hypothetical protein
MTFPSWLPPLFPADPWTYKTYDDLYRVFCNEIRNGALCYRGNAVWHFPKMEDGKEDIFWHLTSIKDKISGDRLPDLRRCERITWVRPLLKACPHADIDDWDYEEGDGTIKTYVWLRGHDFLVLMKKFPNGERRLITSYPINYEHKRKELRNKLAKRV